MKQIEAFKTVDGLIFESEKSALDHEDDLLGEELTKLFRLMQLTDGPRAIEHSGVFRACMEAIKNKNQLVTICAQIVRIVEDES